MGRNLRWSIVAASRRQRRMAVQDNGAKVRLFPATNQSVPRRLRPSLCESTYSPAKAAKELLND